MPPGRRKIIKDGLSAEQLKFCELYTSGDKEFYGNGVQSYLEVYDIDKSKPKWYNTACVQACKLLSNAKVIEKINSLLESGGFNDENVKKQHTFLINQHEDLSVKQKALSDFYKLKGKYEPERLVVETVNRSAVEQRLENLKN